MTTLTHIAWLVFVLGIGASYFTSSALVHELGHWIMGRVIGATCNLEWRRSGRLVVLTTRFAMSCSMTPVQDLLVTSAGVILQSMASVGILLTSDQPILVGVAVIGLPLIGLNLAPVHPTDGYFLIRAIRRIRGGDTGNLIRICILMQWLLFGAAVTAAIGYSIAAALDFWEHRDGATAGLAALGVAISIRVLHRLDGLCRGAPP